jgi:hypothetical protein
MSTTTHASYTPGYAGPKRLMIVLGALVLLTGFWQLRVPLRLLLFGARATTEAVDVVKTKPGVPDVVLHSQAEVQAAAETRDRSYVFWNEFQFEPAGQPACIVRAPAGSALKPLYPLLDEDGLPTTVAIWYDPAHPETAAFPEIMSVWFAPGVLVVVGLLAMIIGSILLYWADRPIPLPHLAGEDGGT